MDKINRGKIIAELVNMPDQEFRSAAYLLSRTKSSIDIESDLRRYIDEYEDCYNMLTDWNRDRVGDLTNLDFYRFGRIFEELKKKTISYIEARVNDWLRNSGIDSTYQKIVGDEEDKDDS